MQTLCSTITLLLLLLTAVVSDVSRADSVLEPHNAYRTAPPLELLDLAGKRHSLEDYRGKVVLVNFFGTWCPPCLQEMPSLLVLASAWKEHPFTVLAVDVGDPPARLRQLFGEQRPAFTVLLDSRQTAARRWGALTFPTSFVVDPEGRLRYAVEGAVEWDDPKVASQIAALMPKAPSSGKESEAPSNNNSQPAVRRSD
jgi:thiol-disulfide isomerase/thioredoxin